MFFELWQLTEGWRSEEKSKDYVHTRTAQSSTCTVSESTLYWTREANHVHSKSSAVDLVGRGSTARFAFRSGGRYTPNYTRSMRSAMAQVSSARGHSAHVQSTKKIAGKSGTARATPVPTALHPIHPHPLDQPLFYILHQWLHGQVWI